MAKAIELLIPQAFRIGNDEVNREVLLNKVKESTAATINGVGDITGYKAAVAHRASFRTVRTTLEKVRKELSAPHQKFVKQLKEKTDELGAIASQGEFYFDDLITAIDNEKERIKKEKADKVVNRVNELMGLESVFSPLSKIYSFAYDANNHISVGEVADMDEQDWGDFIATVSLSHSVEQQRLTTERLNAEQAEIDAEEAKESLRVQNEALLTKRTALRQKELKLLGYNWNESDQLYIHATITINLTLEELEVVGDEQWEKIIQNLENFTPPEEPTKQYMTGVDPYASTIGGEDSSFTIIKSDAFEDDNDSVIASGNPVSEPDQSYVANESAGDAIDYSLNDFESLTKHNYTGSKKDKQVILDAIADYKAAMDKF